MQVKRKIWTHGMVVASLLLPALAQAQADLVLHNGKVVTGDDRFTIAQAIAIKGEPDAELREPK